MTNPPPWRAGDILVSAELFPFAVDRDPVWRGGRWLLGEHDADEYRLATEVDFSEALIVIRGRINKLVSDAIELIRVWGIHASKQKERTDGA